MQSKSDNRETYTFKETVARLGVNYVAATRQVREGRFPVRVIRYGSRLLVPKAELDAYLGVHSKPDAAA